MIPVIKKWKWITLLIVGILVLTALYRLSVYSKRFSIDEIWFSNPFKQHLGEKQIEHQYAHSISIKQLCVEHELEAIQIGDFAGPALLRTFLLEYLYPTQITSQSRYLIAHSSEKSPDNCVELDGRDEAVLYVCE